MSKLTHLEYEPYDCSEKKGGELLSSNRFRISILIVAALDSLFLGLPQMYVLPSPDILIFSLW